MADREQHPVTASFAALLVDESPDALIALSVHGQVLSWNRGARVMFGYSAEEAIGSAIDELTVPEDGRAEARRALQDTIERGSTLTEAIRRHKNGTLIQVDVSMRRVDAPRGETF